jgi:hypothetical protein
MKFIVRILGPIELLLTLAAIFGLFLRFMHLAGGTNIVLICLLLAPLYFIRAFIPADIPGTEKSLGFLTCSRE